MNTRGFKAIFGIIMIMVAFILFPLIMTSTSDIMTDETTVSDSVTTGAAATSGWVELGADLYDDDTNNVTSVTSDDTDDSPAVDSYNAGNNSVLIDGLDTDTTRTISVTYLYDATSGFTGLADLTQLAPTILMLALIGTGIVMLYQAAKG